jgi:predicted Zn finger-like uncharacterized protein
MEEVRWQRITFSRWVITIILLYYQMITTLPGRDDMICPFCNGKKHCKYCDGKGIVLKGLFSKNEKPCGVCEGSGYCNHCKGNGEIEKSRVQIENGKVKCGKCGNTVPVNSPMCPKCGVNFADEWFECQVCHSVVTSDTAICNNCGAEFE